MSILKSSGFDEERLKVALKKDGRQKIRELAETMNWDRKKILNHLH